MKTITLNVPFTPDLDDIEAQVILASQLYQKGKLSLGQAAEMVGYSKRTFIELLADYGVSVFNQDPDEIHQDLIKARKNNR